MIRTPAHKQTDPAKRPGQVVFDYSDVYVKAAMNRANGVPIEVSLAQIGALPRPQPAVEVRELHGTPIEFMRADFELAPYPYTR